MEMICFYLMGYADLDELCGALGIKKPSLIANRTF